MAWTTPRTWVTNEVATAALLNTHLRDNLDFLRAHHGCSLFKSAAQTVTSGSDDLVTWNSEDFDTDALHSTVTNTGRITVPSGLDGYWEFICQVQTDADAASHVGSGRLHIRKNAAGSAVGGTELRLRTFMGHTAVQGHLAIVHALLAAGYYVEAFFFSGGENRDIQAGVDQTNFVARYLGS
jgi:hypothetical protein